METMQLIGVILIVITVIVSIVAQMLEGIDVTKVTVIGGLVAALILRFFFFNSWQITLAENTIHEHVPSNFIEAIIQMVDLDVIFIIFSVSIIVSVTKKVGFFDFLSLAIVKRTKGDPKRLLISLGALSFILSMFFDNLSSIIILGSLTVIICKELELNPQPYVLFVGTNTIIGGLPTPVSSLPNLIFYKTYTSLLESDVKYQDIADISFLKFTLIMFPITILFFLVAVVYFFVIYKKELAIKISEEKEEQIKRINPWTSIDKKSDLVKSIIIIVTLFTGFILADQIRLGMGIISLFAAMFALLLFSLRLNEFIEEGIEWEMIVYYTALFVLMGVLVGVGSLQPINNLLVGIIGDGTTGNLILVALVVGMIGLPIAGFLSGSSAAILFAQIFNKVTASIGIKGLGFWFAFVCAGNMGGSLSPLGSITILLAIKILRREGDDITFMYYIKKTLLLTLIHAFMAIGYTFILIALGF